MTENKSKNSEWFDHFKDLGVRDLDSNYIQDVIEYKNYKFICHREKFKNGIVGSFNERENLKILRISHCKSNDPSIKCPLCQRDRDLKCEEANLKGTNERITKRLDMKRKFRYEKNLIK